MSTPSVDMTVLDNQLGIRAPADAVLAIVATASSGSIDTPQPFAGTPNVVAEHTDGSLVEAAAYAIERFGLQVLLVRADAATDGAYGSLSESGKGSGTSNATADSVVLPTDERTVEIQFLTAGTVGTPGITYRETVDGEQTWETTKALGTANAITLPYGGGKVNLSSGTIAAGYKVSFVTSAPVFGATELAAALDALKLTMAPWTGLLVYGDMNSTLLSTLDAKLEEMHALGIERRCVAGTRKQNVGESFSTYKAAMETAFGSSTSKRVMLCAGGAKIDSSVSRRRYRRSPALAIGALAAAVSEEIDLAELAYGPLPGVYIVDANGNPDEVNEYTQPGLDDDRFTVLRSWRGRVGAFVNNPRLFSPVGSDFLYLQHGRVIDLACDIARAELEPLLSKGVIVKTDGSGRIDPNEALTIEGQVNGKLSSGIVGVRKASAAVFVLSRTDDVLRTGQISWKVRVVPLAYLKKLKGEVALVASANSTAIAAG